MFAPGDASGGGVTALGTVADPAELTDLARILDQRADAVVALGERIVIQLSSAAWAGPAADTFRSEADQFVPVLNNDADGLRAAAADLRRLADQLQQELDLLHAIEDKVRAWFAVNPPGASATPSPWPATDLPPTGDPRWREVQQAFTTAGVL
jgi:uncharacterized protein YukE